MSYCVHSIPTLRLIPQLYQSKVKKYIFASNLGIRRFSTLWLPCNEHLVALIRARFWGHPSQVGSCTLITQN